jgi:hypothetical protein
VVGVCVPGRRYGLNPRVAKLNDFTIRQRDVLELDSGARGEVGRGASALD